MPLPNSNKESRLSITLFGSLTLRLGDQPPTELPPQQSAALLSYLALNIQQAHPRESLAALLWPESEPEKARQNLRRCLSYLRDLLEKPPFLPGSVLIATRTSVQLNPQAVTTDVAEFEGALKAASQSPDREERIRLRSEAAQRYRGELLPGFYQDGFVLEQYRLAERYREALGLLVTDLEAAGDLEQALAYAHRTVILDPLSEEAHGVLMRLYAALGQPSAIQRQYQELEARLQKEFGEGPSEETRLLVRRLQEEARRNTASRPGNPLTQTTAPSNGTLSLVSGRQEGSHPAEEVRIPPVATAPASASSNRWTRMALVGGVACALLSLLFLFWQRFRIWTAEQTRAKPAAAIQQPIPTADRTPTSPSQPGGAPTSAASSKQTDVTGVREGAHKPHDPLPSNSSLLPKATGETPGAGKLDANKPDPATVLQTGSEDVEWAVHYVPHPGETTAEEGKSKFGSEPAAMVEDTRGNLYVTGFVYTLTTDVDYLTLKYSPEGKLLWTRRYNGPNNDVDRAKSIAVDAAGNVYVTGESDGGKGQNNEAEDRLSCLDITTIKYGPDGNPSPSWPDVGYGVGVRRYAGDADGRDSGRKVAVDNAGNVYVFGQSWGGSLKQGGTGSDLVLIKYSATGEQLWVKRHPGKTDSLDAAGDMNLYDAWYVVITGTVLGADNLPDILTVCYTPDGNKCWEDSFSGEERMGATSKCIVTDTNQCIYIVGTETIAVSHNFPPGETYLVLKYNLAGKRLWDRPYPWKGYGYHHHPVAAVVDGKNQPVITGWILCDSYAPGCGTLKYAADGKTFWADPYRSPGHNGYHAGAIGINSLGNMVVGGWGSFVDPTTPNGSTTEFTLLQYPSNPESFGSQEGNVPKLQRCKAVPNQAICLMAIDAHDNVVLCGQVLAGKSPEITLVKFRH